MIHNVMIVHPPNVIANCVNEYLINISSQLAESIVTDVHFDHNLHVTINYTIPDH